MSDSGRPLMYVIPIGLSAGIGAAMSPYRTIYHVKYAARGLYTGSEMRRLAVATPAVLGFGLFVMSGQQPASAPAVFTAAQAEAGKAAYESSCQKCHTETLTGRDGTGEIPEFLEPYGGKIPPLAGANAAFTPFLTKWGPRKTNALYRRIREAVGGFPPPNRKLDEELCLQLTAYVLQVNGARPGTQPLTSATDLEIRSITKSAGR